MLDYVRDPAEIYRRSFAAIAAEVDVSGMPADMTPVLARMIHACGMTDLAASLRFSDGAGEAGRAALAAGAPLLCDVRMVAAGIMADRLVHGNPVLVAIDQDGTAELARDSRQTRSAAGIERLRDRLAGTIVVIGNAPTALFRLLELVEAGAPRPALVVGMPVGFVGAAESKAALAQNRLGLPFITVLGRRGGSAMAAAAVNALILGAHAANPAAAEPTSKELASRRSPPGRGQSERSSEPGEGKLTGAAESPPTRSPRNSTSPRGGEENADPFLSPTGRGESERSSEPNEGEFAGALERPLTRSLRGSTSPRGGEERALAGTARPFKRRQGATSRARHLRAEQTDAEYCLWKRLSGRELGGYKFVRQVPLGPYIVDFLCRSERLVVEVDGEQHAFGDADQRRTAWLNGSGYSVLRFWNHEVLKERSSVLDCVLAVLVGEITKGSAALRFSPSPGRSATRPLPEGRGGELAP